MNNNKIEEQIILAIRLHTQWEEVWLNVRGYPHYEIYVSRDEDKLVQYTYIRLGHVVSGDSYSAAENFPTTGVYKELGPLHVQLRGKMEPYKRRGRSSGLGVQRWPDCVVSQTSHSAAAAIKC